MSPLTHYALLGVSETASATEIRRAYRAKALLLHPDVQARRKGGRVAPSVGGGEGGGGEGREVGEAPSSSTSPAALAAAARSAAASTSSSSSLAPPTLSPSNAASSFIALQEAFRALSLPASRRAYDARLLAARRLEGLAPPAAPYARVSWRDLELEESEGAATEGGPWMAFPCKCGGTFRLSLEDALSIVEGADAEGGDEESAGSIGKRSEEVEVWCADCSLHAVFELQGLGEAEEEAEDA